MGTTRLTIYLMSEGLTDLEEALDKDKPKGEVRLAADSGLDGRFYRAVSGPKEPGWVAYVRPILSEDLADLRSSSASGLLLIRTRERIFAVTFGYGRSLLDLSKIEFQFGLRVALNRINPSQLRSLDTKTFEDMVVTTAKAVSRSAELPTFGIDISTDLLRAVTGEPRDTNFAKRLSGSDALVMNIESKSSDLPRLCGELLDAFEDDYYKMDFGWIDQLSLVRDMGLQNRLDELLVSDLSAGDTGSTHMAVPEPVGWEDIDAFKIGGTRNHEYDDLDLEAYLVELGERRSKVGVPTLKSRKVAIRFARSDEFDSRWPLYRCLVSEQRIDGKLYVLVEGRWFAIGDSLVAELDQYLGTLASPRASLIEAKPGENEKAYNRRLAGSGEGLLNLDARIKRPGGAASGIELCDVLSDTGEFIHVKRKSRSSTLSHLFAQGSVSAETFIRDGEFRDEIRKVIEADSAGDSGEPWLDLVPTSAHEVDRSRKYSVTFVVVANSSKSGADWLPFFSKLNLMQHGRRLRGLGFDVAVARVAIA